MAKPKPPVRGDRFLWRDTVIVEIRRVAADGTWADALCMDGLSMWRRRLPLPLPETFQPMEAVL